MIVYNLTQQTLAKNLENLRQEDPYWIALSQHEVQALEVLGIDPVIIKKIIHHHENVHFTAYHGLDFLSFMFYEQPKENIVFDKFSLLLGSHFFVFIYSSDRSLGKHFADKLIQELFSQVTEPMSLVFAYYYFLSHSFSSMFATLDQCESILENTEDALFSSKEGLAAANRETPHFAKVAKMRNQCFQLKKFNRQLLYLGDQLLLNDNQLILAKDMRYFHNLDTNINILYEYSADVYERSQHLMEIFDTQATYRTNNLLNKLTILMAIATPLTFITGLYGMNFVNMPELQSENGYFITLGAMFCILLITLLLLKRKRML